MKIRNILFDLDGTLTDSKPGIIRSFQYALEKLDMPVIPEEDLLWCIGPPLKDSFEKILGNGKDGLAEKAVAHYRERFGRIGKFENTVYDDIPETLARLNSDGFILYVATSKLQVFAREIIHHFNLSKYFKQVFGSSLNGSLNQKSDLINHILKNEGLARNETVMVGDRKHDIAGAKKSGVKSIGVTYGYGTRKELTDSGADFIVSHPSEIPDIFIS